MKGEVDRLQREVDRAEGTLDALRKRLKDEFGCGTLEDAEAKLIGMEDAAKEAEGNFASTLDKFEAELAGHENEKS